MKLKHFTLLMGLAFLGTACHFEDFDERCEREATTHTEKQCPRRMDEHTVMDSMVYDKTTRTLNYYYTIQGLLDNDSIMTPNACNILGENIKMSIINSVDLKKHKEQGINFCYCYHSKSTGKVRAKITITKEDYTSIKQ